MLNTIIPRECATTLKEDHNTLHQIFLPATQYVLIQPLLMLLLNS